MRVFLSGGAGMVGRNFLEHNRSKDCVIFSPTRAELDLFDERAVFAYLVKTKPDCVVHAAGLVGGIQANIAAPANFLADNLRLSLNVISGAQRAGIRQLINVSSASIYPKSAAQPLREETVLTSELDPSKESYALAKIASSRLCAYINRQFEGYAYKNVIPCNLYGRYDKFDPKLSHMIPAVIDRIAQANNAGADEVEIWGTGEARREFMYAGDFANFLHVALDRFAELPEEMNVGLGYDYSILDYYQMVADAVGFRGLFSHDLSKPSGASRSLLDISRLKEFGWTAPTTLPRGIELTYEFYRNEVLS